MTSSISSLFNRSSLRAVLWIAVAIMCLQLAAANENVTSQAVTDFPHRVEHHGVAVNEVGLHFAWPNAAPDFSDEKSDSKQRKETWCYRRTVSTNCMWIFRDIFVHPVSTHWSMFEKHSNTPPLPRSLVKSRDLYNTLCLLTALLIQKLY